MAQQDRDPIVLAIDHGTSGIKASLVTVHGRILDSAFEPTPITFLPGGGAEQDPDDWWRALVAASGTLLRGDPERAAKVVAVGVSSTFSSTVAVDRDGRPVMNSLTWMDSRGERHVRRLMSGFPSVAGYSVRNLIRWIPKTGGGPTLSGKDDIAHVLYIKHERPELYRRTAAFLPSKDYLNLRLTGRIAASFDSMQLFWVSDTRDINRIHYDADLIAYLDIDRSKMPEMLPSTAILGSLTPAAAEQLGLPATVKVVCGSPDHQAACIGSGAVRDYEGHLYVGTSSWVQCIVPFKKTDVFHSIASLPTSIPGRYQCANEQDIAGGCLTFLVDKILFPQLDMLGVPRPIDPYHHVDQLAATAPPGSDKLIFTPWLNGERTPVEDNQVRAGLFNLAKTTTTAHLARAFLEGVALNTRWSLQYVEKFVGRKLDPLNMIGGGAKSAVWAQIFADALDRTIRQMEDPLQANARGAALIASVGLGHIRFEDIPQLVPCAAEYRPNPANRRIYDELFREFVAIYRSNRRMYHRLNAGE